MDILSPKEIDFNTNTGRASTTALSRHAWAANDRIDGLEKALKFVRTELVAMTADRDTQARQLREAVKEVEELTLAQRPSPEPEDEDLDAQYTGPALRHSVYRFALHMESKLREHDDKGARGWLKSDIDWLFVRLRDEVNELGEALVDNDSAETIRESADVANYAMMIADKLMAEDAPLLAAKEAEPAPEAPAPKTVAVVPEEVEALMNELLNELACNHLVQELIDVYRPARAAMDLLPEATVTEWNIGLFTFGNEMFELSRIISGKEQKVLIPIEMVPNGTGYGKRLQIHIAMLPGVARWEPAAPEPAEEPEPPQCEKFSSCVFSGRPRRCLVCTYAKEPDAAPEEPKYGPEVVTEVWDGDGWIGSNDDATVFNWTLPEEVLLLGKFELALQTLNCPYRTSPTDAHEFGREWDKDNPGDGYVSRKESDA